MATGESSSAGAGITPDQFSQLMEAIQASQERIDGKLAEFRDEVRIGQEDAAAKALKRVHLEKPYAFRRKGNEEQATFNSKLEDAIQEAQAEIAGHGGTSPALDRAKAALQKGAKLLCERQKLIKIADRSEHGWGVVAEYTADELAEDSEDEKRLEKAEKAAERKAAKRRRTVPRTRRRGSYPPQSSQAGAPSAAPVQSPLFLPKRPTTAPGGGARAIGPCFACGELGHLRSFCPKTPTEVGSKKWYPSPSDESRSNECNSSDEGASEECASDECASDECTSDDTVCQGDIAHVNSRDWEAEATGQDPKVSPFVSVQGRLKERVSFWKEVLKAPETVLRTIESGYVLPLKCNPTPLLRYNQQSALANADFVQQSISELLANRCIRQIPNVPYICSPLSVVESSNGKKRLVVNLRHLNKFLWKQKFKYEDLRVAMLLFEKGDFLFSFDLKSGYHHVDIAEVHHKYLGFSWGGCYYVFTVLPFGLSTACYMFTKLLRPLVRYWRSRGTRIVVYLDDGLGAAAGSAEALNASELVQTTLKQAGFVVNEEKSVWQPTQRLQWLGFVIDLSLGQIEVPHEKLSRLLHKLQEVTQASQIPARSLASIIGKIISMGLAVGPVSRFMTRSLYAVLESRVAWCELLTLSVEAQNELQFWAASLVDYKSQPIWRSPSAMRVVYSDASDTGYGGYVVEHGPCSAYGQWTEEEAKQSSTWRELTAVCQVLRSVACKLSNTRVRWFSDNQNVVRILQVGSKQAHLQTIAVKIFSLAVHWHICLEPEWIPRESNEQADYLSRIIDLDDWFLNPHVFSQLDADWGPHTIDRFASCHNAQLPRFNSRCWNPGSEAVDAFTVDWAGENNWWCPPIALIPRVIRHAQACSAQGTLVVPCWPSAPFWPILCPSGSQFASFIVEYQDLPLESGLFLPGPSGSVLFNHRDPNTRVFALRCEFAKL